MPGISLILGRGPTYAIQRVVSSAKWGSAGKEQVVHCPHSFPHPCDLPAVMPIATTTFTLSTPRRQTTSSHMTYILVLHNRRPLTFPFPLFLTFGFSGRYLDFFLSLRLLVTLPDLCRSPILSCLRNDHISFVYTNTRVLYS